MDPGNADAWALFQGCDTQWTPTGLQRPGVRLDLAAVEVVRRGRRIANRPELWQQLTVLEREMVQLLEGDA